MSRAGGRAAGVVAALLLALSSAPPIAAAAGQTGGRIWYPSIAQSDLPDDSPGQPPTSGAAWRPPPVDMSLLPPDGPPAAPGPVRQKYQCLRSGTNGAVLTEVPPAQAMLNIRAAQQFSTGRNVTVAVIDTGVNRHRFLTDGGRLLGGGDYVAPSARDDGTVDCDGHGTITAGIVAANTAGAGLGFTGVAPDATILAIRQSSQAYVTTGANPMNAGTTASLAQAVVHAVDLGAKVITTSVDECEPVPNPAEAPQLNLGDRQLQAAVHYAVLHDVVVINSAGNIGNCKDTPQNADPDPNKVNQIEIPAVFADDVLSVASVDPASGDVSAFSVWGPWVSVAAPGEGIVSLDPAPGATGLANLYSEPGSTTPNAIQGTSFAAPYVAGLAALLRAKYPNLSAREIMYRIEATAQHPSGRDGRDNRVGYGVIDPVAALTALIPGQNGVPRPTPTAVHATAPKAPVQDRTALWVALLGSAGAATALLVLWFVLRRSRVDGRVNPRR